MLSKYCTKSSFFDSETLISLNGTITHHHDHNLGLRSCRSRGREWSIGGPVRLLLVLLPRVVVLPLRALLGHVGVPVHQTPLVLSHSLRRPGRDGWDSGGRDEGSGSETGETGVVLFGTRVGGGARPEPSRNRRTDSVPEEFTGDPLQGTPDVTTASL